MAENLAIQGDIYLRLDELDSAVTKYVEAASFFAESGSHFDCAQVTMITGNIYLAQNKYLDAQTTYLKSLEIAEREGFADLVAHINNNLGVIYLDVEDFDDATRYFKTAISAFESEGDFFNAAVSKANVFSIMAIQGESQTAINGYLDLISYFLKVKSWEYVAHGYNEVAGVYFAQGKQMQAEEFVNLALATVRSNIDSFKGPSSFYRASVLTRSSAIAFKKGDFDKALKSARLGFAIAEKQSYLKFSFENAEILQRIFIDRQELDSALYYSLAFIQYYTDYESDRDTKQITQLRMQQEFDAMERDRELRLLKSKAENERKEILYLSALIVVILFGAIVVIQYKNQKIKTDREILRRQNSELEKERLKDELSFKNKELATNMMYLLEKNEFIGSLVDKLVEIRERANKGNMELVQGIIGELKRNSSQGIWEEFEMRFKNVHSEFYNSLQTQYPDLTPNEVRLCAFLRLNMSTKEISAITHQSVKSINMARFRLRKKLNIDQDENLIAHMMQL